MTHDVVTTDISDVSKAFAVLGGFIVIYGLVSFVAKDRLYLSEPLIAVVLGIITGPYVLGWVDPLSWGTTQDTNYVTYEFSRLVIGVQVLFTGITLPKAYLHKEAISIAVLLGIVMTIAWFICALLIWGLIPNLTFLESLALSAAITPTDPVLANSIVKGRFAEQHVPVNLRNILLAEAGANDGLGFPFMFLAIYLLDRTGIDAGTSIGSEVGRWIYGVLIYRILLSCVYGAVIGVLAHKTLKWSEERGYIDRDNFFAYGFGLALFTLGTTGLFNSDDILACFVAGNAFTWWDWYRVRTQVEEEDSFQDIIDSLLNAAIFIYIGAIIPWGDYSTGNESLDIDPWRIVLLGMSVLVWRRLPWLLALKQAIPAITSYQDASFAGWFGPIGVGAVYYIQVALREIPDDGTRDRLRAVYTPVVLFCVFSSVLAHGITVPIAKLGPNVVRRTQSFSQRRTISFSAPPSRTQTMQSPDDEPNAKEFWNPLVALAEGTKHVAFFWRKDSFWRKETEYQRKRRVLQSGQISQPMNAVKMAAMSEEQEEILDAQRGALMANLPSSQQDLAQSGSEDSDPSAAKAVQKPEQSANIRDKQSNVKHGSFITDIQHALALEMQRERQEARNELDEETAKRQGSLSRRGRPLDMDRVHTQSVPGTPGGSRVHFHGGGGGGGGGGGSSSGGDGGNVQV